MRILDKNNSDPGSKMEIVGSEINIPDPQHCFYVIELFKSDFTFIQVPMLYNME
jgi:hypothetical protein